MKARVYFGYSKKEGEREFVNTFLSAEEATVEVLKHCEENKNEEPYFIAVMDGYGDVVEFISLNKGD